MLTGFAKRVQDLWTAWKSQATQDDVQAFLGHIDEFQDHAVNMYELADDAADDVIAMALILSSLVKRVLHPATARGIPKKPLHHCHTPAELAAHIDE